MSIKNNINISELFGITGWEIKSYSRNDLCRELILRIERCNNTYYQCSKCMTDLMFCYDHCETRVIRDLPIWGYKCYIEFRQARVYCPQCKKVNLEYLDWVELYQRHTLRYEKYIAGLCDYMPVMDVVDIEGLNKNTLYKIDKKWLNWRNEQYKSTESVKYLGIDEIAIKKNHKYATVFYDLERSTVIGLVKGRKQRNVSSFFRKWGKANCNNVKAVCTDLWSAFHNSVKIHLKHAELVFDKFHVFKYLSDAIETTRRDEQAKLDKEENKILKGCRWLILKRNLTKYKDKRRLKELMNLNENIMKAVLLKEEFYNFYEATNASEAYLILEQWTEHCKESELIPFIKLAKRINRWSKGIIKFFDIGISNGISEGINNKIKVIKRRSYGFHDMDYFFLKILNATGMFPKMYNIIYP